MKRIHVFIGIALIILFVISLVFSNSISGNAVNESGPWDTEITLEVNIPCPGHASLIVGYLKQAGVSDVEFRMPDYFDIRYDSSKLSKEQILNINIFREYSAREVN